MIPLPFEEGGLGTPYYLPPRQGAPAEGWPPSALPLTFITLQPDWISSHRVEDSVYDASKISKRNVPWALTYSQTATTGALAPNCPRLAAIPIHSLVLFLV